MQSNTIAGITISCILGVFVLVYFFTTKLIPKDVSVLFLVILNIVTIFFLFFYGPSNENFYFEVSPGRKKCLIEQVSLNQPPGQRSKNCCPSYTRGGKLPVVQEWEKDDTPMNWKRTDSWTTDKENNAYQSQLPPTEIV
jgi:hypothetical protein